MSAEKMTVWIEPAEYRVDWQCRHMQPPVRNLSAMWSDVAAANASKAKSKASGLALYSHIFTVQECHQAMDLGKFSAMVVVATLCKTNGWQSISGVILYQGGIHVYPF